MNTYIHRKQSNNFHKNVITLFAFSLFTVSVAKAQHYFYSDIFAKGHIYLYAFEGNGKSGTAYLQARDKSGRSSIGLQLRSQISGHIVNALKILPNGYVGIGITSPSAKFHVAGNTLVDGNSTLNNTFIGDIGHGPNWGGFSHKSQVGKDNYSLLASVDGKHTLINKKNTNDGFIGFRVGNVDKMIITNDGNIGIGTTSPEQKLHVSGNAIITGNATIEGISSFNNNVTMDNDVILNGNTISNDTFSINGALNFSNSNIVQQIGINKGLNLRLTNIPNSHFSIQNAFGSDALYVNTKGNIAIGNVTSNLTEQLHVGGRIKASGYIADASTFPDYVFSEEYKLMPLQEVKEYTGTHHTLPGMPSEEEVINKGLDLKKVAIISVEKIEELYLHTIQQQELIEKQKDENDTMKKAILQLQERLTFLEQKKSNH